MCIKHKQNIAKIIWHKYMYTLISKRKYEYKSCTVGHWHRLLAVFLRNPFVNRYNPCIVHDFN